MFILLILHPLLRKLYESLILINEKTPISVDPKPSEGIHRRSHGVMADARLNRRVAFDSYFCMIFLIAVHGVSAFKILLILYINFTAVKHVPRSYIAPFTWTFNICILFTNELGRGYPLATLSTFLVPGSSSPSPKAGLDITRNWGSVLDSYGGLIPRWEILFKISILRLISFNLDYSWSIGNGGASPVEVCSLLIALVLEDQGLMIIRRNNSTLQISPNGIESTHPPRPRTIASAIT